MVINAPGINVELRTPKLELAREPWKLVEPRSNETYGIANDVRKLVAAIPATPSGVSLRSQFSKLNVRDLDGIGIQMVTGERP